MSWERGACNFMNWELQLSRPVRTRHSGLPEIIRTLGDAVDMIDEHLPESLRVSPVWQQVKDMLVTAAETRKGHARRDYQDRSWKDAAHAGLGGWPRTGAALSRPLSCGCCATRGRVARFLGINESATIAAHPGADQFNAMVRNTPCRMTSQRSQRPLA